MKAEFLKIAKVKSEKAFYKKYPTQSAFFKAHPEAKKLIKKAKMGSYIGGDTEENANLINFNSFVNKNDKIITGSTQAEREAIAAEQARLEAEKEKEGGGGSGLGSLMGMFSQGMSMFGGQGGASGGDSSPDASSGGAAKYGKRIPAAQWGVSTEMLGNALNTQYSSGNIDFDNILQNQSKTNYVQDTQNVKDANLQKQYPDLGPTPAQQQNIAPDSSQYISSTDETREKKGGQKFIEKLPGGVGKIAKAFGALAAEKQAKLKAKQNLEVSDVALAASRTRAEESERRYSRPEDVKNTGEEFFPVYGVGSNRDVARNGTEIQNTYSPNTLYNDLGYTPLNNPNEQKSFRQGGSIRIASNGVSNGSNAMGGADGASSGGTPWGAIGQAGSGLANSATGNNAGGAIGGEVGGAIGSIWGPAGKAIGKTAGSLIGGLVDTNPKKIKKYQNATNRNIKSMGANQFGQSLQSQYNSYAENGSQVQQNAMDGELQIYDGGAESISHNAYLPDGGETVMFKGPSHKNGGMPITFGQSPVEVEGGEPAVKLANGSSGEENLTVFGNLKIPKMFEEIDPKAKNKKFKNYINDLSKIEAKQNKIVEKSTKDLELLDINDSFDKLKLSSYEANINGANMVLKDMADKKIKAANLQNAINDTASEYGLDAAALAKGKYKKENPKDLYAEYGSDIPKAQKGVTTDDKKRLTTEQAKAQGYKKNAKGEWTKLTKKGTPEKVEIIPATEAVYEETAGRKVNAPGKGSDEFNKAFAEARAKGKKEFPFKGKMYTTDIYDPETQSTQAEQKLVTAATPEEKKVIAATPDEYDTVNVNDPETKPIPYKRSKILDIANEVLPYFRPSDAEELDASQLYGEMYALSNNQLEPVQAQGYRPQLDVPYDISLQDQLNEVTAQTRAGQKLMGYNPAAQANLAAQAYNAKSGILGEEFRLNQAKKDQVYSSNRQTMNDAQLKNIGIFDQQYERQSQAKSNTKDVTQAALNSISSKYAQNALENKTLKTYENMYNYRFGKDMRAENMNGFQQFNIPNVSSQEGQTQVPIYDAEGKNIVGYQLTTTPTTTTPTTTTLATPGFNPNEKIKNGKSINKSIFRNGSIVKALKNI